MTDDDRGFLYGDGLFETLRVYPRGRVRWLARHLARLQQSAQALGFPDAQVQRALQRLGQIPEREPGIWRLTMTRDDPTAPFGGRGSLQLRRRDPPATPNRPRLMLLEGWYWPGDPLAAHKSTSYQRSIEALRRARAAGFEDALMLSQEGLVGEASYASVVAVIDGEAWTPPLRGILAGVTRAGLLDDPRMRELGLRERVLDRADLLQADEIVLLSAGSGARAAKSLEGRALGEDWATRAKVLLDEAAR